MTTFFLRRLIYSLLVFLGVTLITFGLFHFVSGDPAIVYAGKNASPELIQSIRQELGLNKSLPEQYLTFVKQSLTFDWGRSWNSKREISQMLKDGIGASLCLTVPAYFFSIALAVFLALWSVFKQNTWVEEGLSFISLALMSVSFLVYIIYAQKYLAFDLNLFPVYGWDPSWTERWAYLTLPCLIYCLVTVGPKILLFRAALFEQTEQDYVRTALAKGLSPSRIYGLHILKNASVPILTLITSQMPTLITGSLLLEAYFGIPGVGGMLIKAIHNSDFPVIQAFTVIGSLLYIFFNLFNDVLAAMIDARMDLK